MWCVERRSKPIARPFLPLSACFLIFALAGCEGPAAPQAKGVCWRDALPGAPSPDFRALARNVDTLEDCAAELEAIHLQSGADVRGAYQGAFIFVDRRKVASASHLGDFAYPIFQPAQRAEIDTDLRDLIKQRNGAVPSAADIAVERK